MSINHMEQNRMTTNKNQTPKFLRPAGMAAHLQISESTLWNWAKHRAGFPSPLKAGARTTIFNVEQVEAFVLGATK
jgi:predicted DNA-binding transcriptional regulator AlpA